jgi:2-amino-4-hydroxy-6-hydroxymethyldihydropteridine diphosphokinase
MNPVLLALGGNQGDRATTLHAAVLGCRRFLNVTAVSPVYETAPMYDTEQDAFLNLALVAETKLAPRPLLTALKFLEQRLGRIPTHRYGPRTIDIDIVLFGDRTVAEPDLEIPHPRMAERAFVLAPAADIAPDWAHPVTGLTVRAMLDALGGAGDVRPYVPPPVVRPARAAAAS